MLQPKWVPLDTCMHYAPKCSALVAPNLGRLQRQPPWSSQRVYLPQCSPHFSAKVRGSPRRYTMHPVLGLKLGGGPTKNNRAHSPCLQGFLEALSKPTPLVIILCSAPTQVVRVNTVGLSPAPMHVMAHQRLFLWGFSLRGEPSSCFCPTSASSPPCTTSSATLGSQREAVDHHICHGQLS